MWSCHVTAAFWLLPHACARAHDAPAWAYALALGQVAPIIEILPALLRLFPVMRTLPIARGVAIPLTSNPLTDPQAQQQLDAKLKLKQRERDKTKDSSQVIKLSDAIACVESKLNDTTLIWEFIKTAVPALIKGAQTHATSQDMFDKIVECLREDAMRQDTVRRGSKVIRNPRPARGHGEGRFGK
jgi:hypothetical protein